MRGRVRVGTGGGAMVERLARGDHELFVGAMRVDLARSAGRARRNDRAGGRRGGAGLGEARATLAGGLGGDLRELPGRAGHRPGVQIEVKVALGQAALDDRRLGHGREDIDVAVGQLGAHRRGP